jgi:hypothetical protein
MFADMKFDEGAFATAYAAACLCGRKDDFRLLNTFAMETESGLLGSLGSNTYNPLMSIKSPVALTAALLRAATGLSDASGNDYWSDVKDEVVDTLVKAFLSTNMAFSCADMYAALETEQALQKLISICRDPEATMVMRGWYEEWTSDDARTRGNFSQRKQGAKMFFRALGTGTLGKVLNTYEPDITLERAYTTNQIVWVVLPALLMENTAKALGKLILADLSYLAGYTQVRTRDKKPFIVVVDEFESFVFKGITDLFDKGRSAGICMIVAHQTSDQISLADSAELRDVILSNCNNQFILRLNNINDAKMFATMFGEAKHRASLRIHDISVMEGNMFNFPPTDFLGQGQFECLIRTNAKGYRGHIVCVPSDFEFGTEFPRPHFTPSTSRENGVRILEEVAQYAA